MKDEIKARLAGKKIYTYVRVSSEYQDHGARQSSEIARFLKPYGVKIEAEFSDEGIKRDTPLDERPGFQKLLKVIKKGDMLVVQETDRLFGGRKVPNELLNETEERGFEIFATKKDSRNTNPLFITDPGKVKEVFDCAFDNEDWQNASSQKVIEHKTIALNQGRYNGGRLPFYNDVELYQCEMDGKTPAFDDDYQLIKQKLIARIQRLGRQKFNVIYYDDDGKAKKPIQTDKMPKRDERYGIIPFLVPTTVPGRIEAIKKLFELINTEYVSPAQCVKRMKALCDPAGIAWTIKLIKNILRSQGVIGLPQIGKRGIEPRYYYNEEKKLTIYDKKGQKKKGFAMPESHWREPEKQIYDPIIDPDLFNSVQKRLDEMWTPERVPSKQHFNLLKGLISHARCDETMTMFQSRSRGDENISHYNYKCRRHTRQKLYKQPETCPCCSISLRSLKYIIDDYFVYAGETLIKFPTEDTKMIVSDDFILKLKELFQTYKEAQYELTIKVIRAYEKFGNKKPFEVSNVGIRLKIENEKLVIEEETMPMLKIFHKGRVNDHVFESTTISELYDNLREAERKELEVELKALKEDHRNQFNRLTEYKNKRFGSTTIESQEELVKSLDSQIETVKQAMEVNLVQTAKNVLGGIKELQTDIERYKVNMAAQETSKARYHLERVIKKLIVEDKNGKVSKITVVPISDRLEKRSYDMNWIKEKRSEDMKQIQRAVVKKRHKDNVRVILL